MARKCGNVTIFLTILLWATLTVFLAISAAQTESILYSIRATQPTCRTSGSGTLSTMPTCANCSAEINFRQHEIHNSEVRKLAIRAPGKQNRGWDQEDSALITRASRARTGGKSRNVLLSHSTPSHCCSRCDTTAQLTDTHGSSTSQKKSLKRRIVHFDAPTTSIVNRIATHSLWKISIIYLYLLFTMSNSSFMNTPVVRRFVSSISSYLPRSNKLSNNETTSPQTAPRSAIATTSPGTPDASALADTIFNAASSGGIINDDGHYNNTPASSDAAYDQRIEQHITARALHSDVSTALQGSAVFDDKNSLLGDGHAATNVFENNESLEAPTPTDPENAGYASTLTPAPPTTSAVSAPLSVLDEVKRNLFSERAGTSKRILRVTGIVKMTQEEEDRFVARVVHTMKNNKAYRASAEKQILDVTASDVYVLEKPTIPDELHVLDLSDHDLTETMKAKLTITAWLEELHTVFDELSSVILAGIEGPDFVCSKSHTAGLVFIAACKIDPELDAHLHILATKMLSLVTAKIKDNYESVLYDVSASISPEDPVKKCVAIFAVLKDRHVGNCVLYNIRSERIKTKVCQWFGRTAVLPGELDTAVKELQQIQTILLQLPIVMSDNMLQSACVEMVSTTLRAHQNH